MTDSKWKRPTDEMSPAVELYKLDLKDRAEINNKIAFAASVKAIKHITTELSEMKGTTPDMVYTSCIFFTTFMGLALGYLRNIPDFGEDHIGGMNTALDACRKMLEDKPLDKKEKSILEAIRKMMSNNNN